MSDGLQFGYKVGASTTQCTWLVQEVVQLYLRHGSHPLVAMLDCSKAFDLARWDVLFSCVLERNLPVAVMRLLIAIYQDQFAWVQWGGASLVYFLCPMGLARVAAAARCCGRCTAIPFL